MQITPERPVLVLGGGPAGLTAAYLLAKAGRPVIVVEAEDQVGGLAKTVVDPEGYRFDLGGHRFFTKVKEVDDLWHEVMGEEFLRRPRQSRIYWNGKFLEYPLQGADVIKKLGPVELVRSGLSYLRALVKPKGNEDSLEEWVSNRFGWRLYQLFFKTYTEKVWGVPCSELRAEWAAQRIKGLSFFSAAKAAFVGNKGNRIKSLISEFNYPRYGPGQMWDFMTQRIREQGGEVLTEAEVTSLEVVDGEVTEVVAGGITYTPSAVISSLPLRDTVALARPDKNEELDEAARHLRYRDFLTIALVLDGDDLFPDNWIYIHDPGVRVGRIQNYRSWSPWMVPDPTTACVGLEYFCFQGDDLWTQDDDALVELAKRELHQLGLADPAKVKRGYVVRVPMAYPMYDRDYAPRVETIKGWLAGISNLQQVGRNGLHRYNNSDHSMLTAMRAVDNLLLGTDHDLWAVNAESVYHEEGEETDKNPYPYRDGADVPALREPVSESA
ncbi:NAD(P)/FAD-dependent oxidoreductase [Capillimicrobium parvum]|uniref:NAD(P)/FAD-dependent oxidoreductase n=1 Tax=Capillimicrobium parvum TaxID=2884022 RepID=UPI00216AD870|nr:NAD(P)/FAD-dependent oxidoreductase [Capillimicrobium parvum]